MAHTLIGYARCSTDKQDLAAQHDVLVKLGVATDRIYTASFGVSELGITGEFVDLLKGADTNLYAAKAAGRNMWCQWRRRSATDCLGDRLGFVVTTLYLSNPQMRSN